VQYRLVLTACVAVAIVALPIGAQQDEKGRSIAETAIRWNQPLAVAPLRWNDFAPVTASCRLYLDSSPGDPIGLGRSYYYDNKSKDIFIVRADLSDAGEYRNKPVSSIEIRFYKQPQTAFWLLVFRTNQLDPGNYNIGLAPGYYDGAQTAAVAQPGHSGLDIGGNDDDGINGRGCNTCSGWFRVYDAKFDYTDVPARVVSFSVEFEQHCNVPDRPPLRGRFEYNYSPPPRRRAVLH
jgi:hypothetical protein